MDLNKKMKVPKWAETAFGIVSGIIIACIFCRVAVSITPYAVIAFVIGLPIAFYHWKKLRNAMEKTIVVTLAVLTVITILVVVNAVVFAEK